MLETAPLYHQLADQIHELIRAGTLRAGDRVPSVRRLSNQQRVSVSTVLQAYQRLEDIGVIEARPQSGYYVRRLAAAVREPEPSRPPKRALTVEVNELTDLVLSYASDPNVVAFGSACAAPELFQLERVRRVLSSVARRDRNALGRYGLPPGTEKLRRAVARRALEWGCRIDHRHLVTTTGCIEAINLCLRAVTKPGDLVALESPTFYGFLQILQSLGLRALEIPTHPRSGISLEALELALAEHPVKAVLVMPNVSNPIGASMSDAAKKRLVELLAAKNVPLIEDHIYAELQFDAPAPRPAKAFDKSGNVMLCSSFSKTLAPGLKVGWIEPGRWRDSIRMLKFMSSGGTERARRARGGGDARVGRLRALAARAAPALRVAGRQRARHHRRVLPARHARHAPRRRLHRLGRAAERLRLGAALRAAARARHHHRARADVLGLTALPQLHAHQRRPDVGGAPRAGAPRSWQDGPGVLVLPHRAQ